MTDPHLTRPHSIWAHLKDDVSAGIAVFLVALPLSLGIALASGAPLFSGLITGIIGGLLVAPLSKSALGISGPAAGLAVLVLSSIEELGFHAFLLAVIIAGCLQILMGLVKAGGISGYFPSSVISGMLSGIGIILFLKQIPHAVGYDRDYEGDFRFVQSDSYSSFSELLHMWESTSPTAMVIALVSLLILILWERPFMQRYHFCQWMPRVLVAIIVATGLNQGLLVYRPEWALTGGHLVVLPMMNTLGDFISQLNAPDFGAFRQANVYKAAVTLAIVASLETLLAVEAIDKLDAYRRSTPSNRELMVQGIGNISAALLGGLPMTQVVVRSSFNVQLGAKSRVSAFIQGVLLLLTVILIPTLLHKIPLACLAAILLVVSYKMARPQTVKDMYQAGLYHFIPFCATIIGMVLTDILIGLAIGLVIALVSILLENHKNSFYFQKMRVGNKTILRLSEHVSFLNKANIQKTLQALPAHSQVVIDATRSKYIDYDVYEILERFRQEAPLRHIGLTLQNLRGYGSLPPVTNAGPTTYNDQQALTPAQVLAILKEGNEHFVNNLASNRNLLEQVNDTRQGQFPIAIILSCMDSRTSVELIFDQGLGDIFSTRVAGNVINDDILGSMEYACKIAGSKLIVVLGHSHCGAIKGACDHVQLDHLTGLLAKIQPAVTAVSAETGRTVSAADPDLVQQVADKSVLLTVAQIKARSPLLNGMLASGELGIVGGMYDIETGKVQFYEGDGLNG